MSTARSLADFDGPHRQAAHLSQHTPDGELMALIRDGDQAAYRLLVQRHLPRTFGLARRLTGSAAEAEDIAQDAFLKVWQRRGQWTDDGAQFTTWLYRVVVNRAIDHKRRPHNDDIDAIAEPPSDAPDAVQVLHRRQVTARLQQAQQKLPEQQQVAIALYYFEGLTATDIAVVMATTVGAVESLLKRARQNLRHALKASAQAVRDSFDDG